MKKGLGFLITILLIAPHIFGQKNQGDLEGTVSFITSENIYVRFSDATPISIGDTLRLLENGSLRPCLQVTNKSSISCVTVAINDCPVSKDMKVIYKGSKTDEPIKDTISQEPEIVEDTVHIPTIDTIQKVDSKKPAQKVYARLSVASYSNISAIDDASVHRIIERGRLDIDHISGSRFSFSSYLNLYQTISQPAERINLNQLRVYNLALKYEIENNLSISLGRKINRNFASLGAIDGLQLEKSLNGFSVGALVGSKPDFETFGYNPNNILFGGFVGFRHRTGNISTNNSIGFIEQKNGANTDRRYAYLQHYSSFNGGLSTFASAELDLYGGNIDTISVQPRLTNLFLSLRYRLNSQWSFMASFDSRKQIIYYETYEASVEQILKNDLPTQGVRLRANYRTKNGRLYGSLGYNGRIRNQQLSSTSVNGHLSYKEVPYLNGTFTIYLALNQSDYLDNNNISLSYRNQLFSEKLEGYFYYRLNTFKSRLYESVFRDLSYAGARFQYEFTKGLTIGVLGEITFSTQQVELYRLNTRIIKRFQ